MQGIGTAVIGFGLAGRVFHAPFVHAVPGLSLRAIVQRSGEDAARAYPEQTTGVRIVRSAAEVFADPAIDVIVVATPNESHLPLAQQALEAGKHVVVDKPLTSTSTEAEHLIRLAQERRRLLIPFHNRRWDGDFLTVKRLLAQKKLGRLVSFQSRFDRFRPGQKPGSWKEVAGGAHGVLFDLGPHLIDQALQLFGMPTDVYANIRHDRDVTEIDDAFDVELGYPGLRVLLGATMLAAEPAPRFLLHGTAGSYQKFGVDPQEPHLVAGGSVPEIGSAEAWLPEAETAWGHTRLLPAEGGALRTETEPTETGDYRHFYAGVRDAVLGKAPVPVSATDAWKVLRLLELARESAAAGRRLPVHLPDGPL